MSVWLAARLLFRRRLMLITVVSQIATTYCVLSYALALVQGVERNLQDASVQGDDILAVRTVAFDDSPAEQVRELIRRDLQAMRGLHSVIAASAVSGLPGEIGDPERVRVLAKTQTDGAHYSDFMRFMAADEATLATLGVSMIAGRNFRPEEIVPFDEPIFDVRVQLNDHERRPVIATAAAAQALGEPRPEALVGRTLHAVEKLDFARPVVGVVESFSAGNSLLLTPTWVILIAGVEVRGRVREYLVRTHPDRVGEARRAIARTLLELEPERDIETLQVLSDFRNETTFGLRVLLMLYGTCGLLLTALSALGIFAAATWNLTGRAREIAIRRALGATRGAILRQFLMENLIMCLLGAAIGAAVCLAVDAAVLGQYMDLPYAFLAPSAVVVCTLGQLASFVPAWRVAAAVPVVQRLGRRPARPISLLVAE